MVQAPISGANTLPRVFVCYRSNKESWLWFNVTVVCLLFYTNLSKMDFSQGIDTLRSVVNSLDLHLPAESIKLLPRRYINHEDVKGLRESVISLKHGRVLLVVV